MTIFTDRDLECVASLRMNWRKEFLLEVVRLRHEREAGQNAGRPRRMDKARLFGGDRSGDLPPGGDASGSANIQQFIEK